MKAYEDLKEIYTGKRALYNHITLFSLLGIMVIFLNNLFAVWGSSLFIDLFAVPPSSTMELWVALLGGFMISIYLFGYSYQYIHSLFKRDECSLLEFTFEPFGTFFRVFPMFFLWQNYVILFSILGTVTFLSFKNNILLYLFAGLMLALMPFVQMVLISFSSRFKYRLKFFYPWLVLDYVDKTLGDVCILFLQIVLLALVPSAIISMLVIGSTYIEHEVYQYAIELACLCFGIYCLLIFKYVFSVGLVRIVKEKLIP